MEDQDTRRAFYLKIIYGLWGLIGAAFSVPAAAYLLFPPNAKKDAEWVDAGDISQFQPKVPEEVIYRRNRVDGWKVLSEKSTAWVVKLSDNSVVAYAPQCTHLGCAYHWDEQKQNFLCPCHSSTFGIDGRVLSGPAPRPLDRLSAKLNGTKLQLGPVEKSEGA